ncbi:MAG: OmpA family protein [Flavobacteriales bacterium]|nr:OmpA family protein [Flavobacteriales bacterium]
MRRTLTYYLTLGLLLVNVCTSHAQKPYKKVNLLVCIDGESKLHIQSGKMFWEHLGDVPPSLHKQCKTKTKVNGKTWKEWKSPFDLDFNTDSFSLKFTILQKHEVSMPYEIPSEDNQWKTTWYFSDPSAKPHTYEVSFIFWPPSKASKTKSTKTHVKEIIEPDTLADSFVPNNITFDTDSVNLTQQAKIELDRIHSLLIKSNPIIEISGHTDNSGDKNKNLLLSQQRAKAIYNYLLSKGYDSSRMTYQGFGDTKPLTSNNTRLGQAKNRRVEIKIIN